MQRLTINQILLILLIILILSNSAEAGAPVVSILASVNPSEIVAGNSGMLTVTVLEIGGNDWIKDPTVIVQASPTEGIFFPQTCKLLRALALSSLQVKCPNGY